MRIFPLQFFNKIAPVQIATGFTGYDIVLH
jgi:hypothetical protein